MVDWIERRSEPSTSSRTIRLVFSEKRNPPPLLSSRYVSKRPADTVSDACGVSAATFHIHLSLVSLHPPPRRASFVAWILTGIASRICHIEKEMGVSVSLCLFRSFGKGTTSVRRLLALAVHPETELYYTDFGPEITIASHCRSCQSRRNLFFPSIEYLSHTFTRLFVT